MALLKSESQLKNVSIEYSKDYQGIMLTAYSSLKSEYRNYLRKADESGSSNNSISSEQLTELKMLRYEVLSLLSGLSGVTVPIPCYVTPKNEPFTNIKPMLTYTDLRLALQQNLRIGNLYIRDLFTKSRHSSITASDEVFEFANSLNYE